MQRINYKSDFGFILRLRDCKGDAVGFPGYDWEARLWTPQNKANAYTASCKGGVCENCYNDNGEIHIVCDGHRLGLGQLCAELTVELPNGIYPDGYRKRVEPQLLDIELVSDAGDCPTEAQTEVAVAYAVIDAYDMAVASGYEGTREDYTASLRLLPGLAATVSDLRQGKREIAEALTEQGIPTAADAPMAEMAEGVRRLYAVPDVDAGARDRACSTDADHTGAYDMVAEVNRHRRADYPYVCGCSFIGREVTLAGADATLLSDGTWIEGRNAVEHTFAGGMSHWAIFYFKEDFYGFPWPQGVSVCDIAAIDSHPCFSASSAQAFVSLFVDAEAASYEGHDFSFGEKAGDIVCNAISELPSGNPIANGYAPIRRLCLPSLICSRRQITNGCPSLIEVCLPNLEIIHSSICASPGRGDDDFAVILSALKTSNTSQLVYMPRGLKKLYLPSLETTAGPVGVYLDEGVEIYVPNLLSAINQRFVSNNRAAVINLGSQKGANLILNGQSVEGVAAINIKPGFTGTLVFNNTSLTAENLRELPVNLGDNTDGATMRIQMGANNLAKLTEDEIAVATAKNYTVS